VVGAADAGAELAEARRPAGVGVERRRVRPGGLA
jgi:hypothetical protein